MSRDLAQQDVERRCRADRPRHATRLADDAVRSSARDALDLARRLVDPRVWGREYPKASSAASAALGGLAGFALSRYGTKRAQKSDGRGARASSASVARVRVPRDATGRSSVTVRLEAPDAEPVRSRTSRFLGAVGSLAARGALLGARLLRSPDPAGAGSEAAAESEADAIADEAATETMMG